MRPAIFVRGGPSILVITLIRESERGSTIATGAARNAPARGLGEVGRPGGVPVEEGAREGVALAADQLRELAEQVRRDVVEPRRELLRLLVLRDVERAIVRRARRAGRPRAVRIVGLDADVRRRHRLRVRADWEGAMAECAARLRLDAHPAVLVVHGRRAYDKEARVDASQRLFVRGGGYPGAVTSGNVAGMAARADTRYRIEQRAADGVLVALEPTAEEVREHAPALAAAYNDPHNSAMMGNTTAMSPLDVIDHFASLRASGGRPFLLLDGGALAGDADLRHIERGQAEMAILVAPRAAQGRGLGTRFARMLHAFGFGTLGLERVFVTILPQNAASLRLFEKLGYALDASAEARAFAEGPSDVSLSLARAAFEQVHAGLDVLVAPR